MKASYTYILVLTTFAILMLMPTQRLETAANYSGAFKHSGDGRIILFDTHTRETLSIVYRDSDGKYDSSSLEAVSHVLRCHGKSERHPISLKLIELIDKIQDHFGAEIVHVISGYRSPEYNFALSRKSSRVAHDSLHLRGLAMDIRIPGVDKVRLGEYARSLKAGGVGVYYSSGFVHIDVGPTRSW
jgi:uncharacterized protein YcbK (DUF882 family)